MTGKFEKRVVENPNRFENEMNALRPIDVSITMETGDKQENDMKRTFENINLLRCEKYSLRSKQLTHLPEYFACYLRNLVHLDLSCNRLKGVPRSLVLLQNLQHLLLDNNCMDHLPIAITELSRLRTLQLSRNCISALPDNLANLESLEKLDLSSNKLKNLPIRCRTMNTLKILDLSQNSLKRIPHCVCSGMTALEELDLSYNVYIDLSGAPASPCLRKFNAKETRCNVRFPRWIFDERAANLQVLNLDGTSFYPFQVPPVRYGLNIKKLSLQRCCFYDSEVSAIVRVSRRLESLDVGNGNLKLGGNSFWTMPVEGARHPELMKKMAFRSTGLPAVGPRIQEFIRLVELDLGNNNISWLPDEICRLKSLEILMIDENLLASLPEGIGELASLNELKANRNNLATLPESMGRLKNLTFLDLYENSFDDFPNDVKSIESLVGFDFERNPCPMDTLLIGGVKYEVMRNALRYRYRTFGCRRETGPRYENIEDLSDTTSSDESSVSSCESDEMKRQIAISPVEENWDESEDSADEFDPTANNDQQVEKPLRFSYMSVIDRQMQFCPADLQPPSIKNQLAVLRRYGLWKVNTDPSEEGCFDDA